MAAIALRTLAAGTIACLMTACVAGEICNVFVVVVFHFSRFIINRFAQKLSPPMPCAGLRTSPL